MKFSIANEFFKRQALLYLAIQVVLWAKVFLFYQWYGQGILLRLVEPQYTLAPLLSPQVFTSDLLVFDWLFHQAVHIAIGIVIFLFARRFSLSFTQLASIIFIADVLHNVGYWFTNTFTSFDLLLLDFVDDFLFMVLFYYLCRYVLIDFAFRRSQFRRPSVF